MLNNEQQRLVAEAALAVLESIVAKNTMKTAMQGDLDLAVERRESWEQVIGMVGEHIAELGVE